MFYDLTKKNLVVPDKLSKHLVIAKAILRASFEKEMFVDELGRLVLNVKGRVFFAVNSFYNGFANLVFFKGERLELLVIQNHSRNLSVYFCSEEVWFGGSDARKGLGVLNFYLKNIKRKVALDEARFGGIIISYPRPYHFFYDSAPGFFNLNLISNKFLGVGLYDSFWLPPCFFESYIRLFHSKEEMNSACFSEHMVFSAPILKKPLSERLGGFDERVRNYIGSTNSSGKVDLFLSKKKEKSFLLWFGVSEEKRKVLNERDLLKLTIDKIAKKITKNTSEILVVFDGLTSPFAGRADEFSTSEKVKGYSQILYEMGVREILDLSGMVAFDKLTIAKNSDLFVSSFLTDSIYPSRFYGVSGIGYGAEGSKVEQHVHHNAELLFGKGGVDSDSWDKKDFKVNLNEFEGLLVKRLDRILYEFS